MKTLLITLTSASTNTGPFDLFSDVDAYAIPFEVNIQKSDLIIGYVSILVPDAATQVRVKSKGVCVNYLQLIIPITTTTTTTL